MTGNLYTPNELSHDWQSRWRDSTVFATTLDPQKPCFYGYEYPPFPSGSLHMGHVRNYIIGDTLARFKRLRGYNVLYTQAFDSLGLPVEDAALKVGKTPAEWLDECIENMTQELLRLGLSYDQSKIYSYHDPEYYKWTQWIFLKLFDAGAIYPSRAWSDWCETCQTALAFEQVTDGCCWRCGTQTTKTQQEQWYIDVQTIVPGLIDGLEDFDIPEAAKTLQHNWIGPRSGLFVGFQIKEFGQAIEVFTTQVSAIYGTTFIGLAPEHPLLAGLVEGTKDEADILAAAREMCTIPRVERMKTPESRGIFLHRHAIHPLTGEAVPLYLAPFVQQELGTGAILGCPAHDTNSFRFAKTMGIAIKQVIEPENALAAVADEAYLGDGRLICSGLHTGLERSVAEDAITAELTQQDTARKGETFKVRDWCISRQRYWSAPIPIIHCRHCGPVPVAEADLPVVLPTTGVNINCIGNPLEQHEEFMSAPCPKCGTSARRESSTLDTFVNSSWSYMRNCNPDYKDAMFDPEAVKHWLPCDFDIGGTENITVANFYFRVILHWLHRLGLTQGSEPFKSSIFHGMVLMEGRKMSKSIGNIVQPADLIDQYGVDSVRFQSMWAARPGNDYNWSEEKAAAARRFLNSVWTTSVEIIPRIKQATAVDLDDDVMTKADKKFAKTLDIGSRKIQAGYDAIELQAVCNDLILLWEKTRKFWARSQGNLTPSNLKLLRRAMLDFQIMLNPIAPHITEELWSRMGKAKMIAQQDQWLNYGQDLNNA